MRLAVFIAAGLLFGAGAAFLSTMFAGAGHGTYIPAAIFFPMTMALAVAIGRISPLLIGLALVQYPLYGAAVAFWRTGTHRLWVVAGLHLVVAMGAIIAVARSATWS